MDYKRFFGRNSEEVAKDLLGRSIVRNTELGSTSARISQVGAYEGDNDTISRAGMRYSPGRIFMMSYRGTYLLNFSTDKEGIPSCVEIREVATHDKVITGAGKVASFLNITPDLEGLLLGNEVQISGDSVSKDQIASFKGRKRELYSRLLSHYAEVLNLMDELK